MMLMGKNQSTLEKPVPGPLSTTNPTWIGLALNLGISGDGSAFNHLSLGTAM
jgi:hypothetical protein